MFKLLFVSDSFLRDIADEISHFFLKWSTCIIWICFSDSQTDMSRPCGLVLNLSSMHKTYVYLLRQWNVSCPSLWKEIYRIQQMYLVWICCCFDVWLIKQNSFFGTAFPELCSCNAWISVKNGRLSSQGKAEGDAYLSSQVCLLWGQSECISSALVLVSFTRLGQYSNS